jgi:hypothetical protein
MSSPEEGGTKIQKRNSVPPMMGGGGPPQMAPQGMPQQMDPRMSQEQMMMMQQQQMQQQQLQQQQMQQQPQGYQINSMGAPKKGILRKSSFGGVSMDSPTIKNTILVVIIFLALNSKILWKQILQFPFMGGVEPSIIALVVNSILAGIIFYLVSSFLM